MKQAIKDIAHEAITELEAKWEACRQQDKDSFVYVGYRLYFEGGKEALALVEQWAKENGLYMECGGMAGNLLPHWIEFVKPFARRKNY